MADEQSDIMQPVIRRNVLMLMSLRGIRGARQLAERLSQPENQISNKLSGRRRWQIEDLPTLAHGLGVEASDLLLLSAARLAHVAEEAMATGTDSGGSRPIISAPIGWKSTRKSTLRLVPPLVTASGDNFHTQSTAAADPGLPAVGDLAARRHTRRCNGSTHTVLSLVG